MRWFLGCLGVFFVIFGGCVLAISVAADKAVFAIGGLLILFLGIRVVYKEITMQRTPPGSDQDQPDAGPP